MADAFTATTGMSLDQAAWDRGMYLALRPELFFDSVVDVEPTNQAQPGTTVTFTQFADMPAATTALSETVDVDAVALSDTQVTVTLVEYGNAVNTTAKLRGTSFLPIDPVVANVLGYNAGISLDTIIRDIAVAGTNVRYAGGVAGRTSIAAANVLTAAQVRRALADLRGANVATFGGYYASIIHPDVSYDLRGETGAAAWRDPHTYSQPAEIWAGEIGVFEGFRFMESPRAPLFVNASSGAGAAGTIDVYATLFMGRQALAKAYSTTDGNGAYPRVIASPVVDKLRRFVPMGWYWLGGYGRFREAALRRIESASSIGTNT